MSEHCFESLYYEAEHRKGELVAERTVLLGALAEMTKARDSAAKGYLEKVSELEDIGRQEERAAIVAWLREPQDESVTPWCELLADSIENGEHLRGDDE